MNQISKEAMDFLNEAREGFSKNSDLTTYRCEEESFIALRGGFSDDCIMVYELGNPVGNFTQQLDKRHKILVDYDEFEKYKKAIKLIDSQIGKVSDLLEDINLKKENFDHNIGYLKALKEVKGLLTK
jgi:hypothetical protein